LELLTSVKTIPRDKLA